jgi:hypothetical protein
LHSSSAVFGWSLRQRDLRWRLAGQKIATTFTPRQGCLLGLVNVQSGSSAEIPGVESIEQSAHGVFQPA